jgi:hypothetical protein
MVTMEIRRLLGITLHNYNIEYYANSITGVNREMNNRWIDYCTKHDIPVSARVGSRPIPGELPYRTTCG